MIRTAPSSVTVTGAVIPALPSLWGLFRAFAVVPDEPADRPKLVAGGGSRLRFDGAIKPDHLFADRRHHRATAARAAGFGGDPRLAQPLNELFYQEPCPPLPHSVRAS